MSLFSQSARWLSVERPGLIRTWQTFVIVAALGLLLFNLRVAPTPWFDEGSHLHVPKTLVQHGVYADISAEGYRYYGPTVGVGPTVMLPIAAFFKAAGVELLYGRLVIVAYALIGLLLAYALARLRDGPLVALLTVTLLLASRTVGREGYVEFGRQVLGEVPGTAFLLFGALAWTVAAWTNPQTEARRHTAWAVAAGLGFGLALVTKNQFALIVPPALALIGVLDWLYYRALDWRLRLIPLAIVIGCYALWLLAQLTLLGPGSFAENVQLTRQAAGGAIFVFRSEASARALAYLVRPDLYGGLLLPALAFAAWRARRRDLAGLCEALLVVLIGLWLVWFVGASLGWPRYAFPAIAIGALLVARAVIDARDWLLTRERHALLLAHGLTLYVAAAVTIPIALSVWQIAHPVTDAQQMAAYLQQHVPLNQIVETWEPELGVLTDHRYHYPSIRLLDTAVRHEWLGGPAIAVDGLADAPPYLVIGPFGGYTAIYSQGDTLEQQYVEVYRTGRYVLYAHR